MTLENRFLIPLTMALVVPTCLGQSVDSELRQYGKFLQTQGYQYVVPAKDISEVPVGSIVTVPTKGGRPTFEHTAPNVTNPERGEPVAESTFATKASRSLSIKAALSAILGFSASGDFSHSSTIQVKQIDADAYTYSKNANGSFTTDGSAFLNGDSEKGLLKEFFGDKLLVFQVQKVIVAKNVDFSTNGATKIDVAVSAGSTVKGTNGTTCTPKSNSPSPGTDSGTGTNPSNPTSGKSNSGVSNTNKTTQSKTTKAKNASPQAAGPGGSISTCSTTTSSLSLKSDTPKVFGVVVYKVIFDETTQKYRTVKSPVYFPGPVNLDNLIQ